MQSELNDQFTFRAPSTLREDLEAIADLEKRSISSYLRKIVEERVERDLAAHRRARR